MSESSQHGLAFGALDRTEPEGDAIALEEIP
jgi:hypothetical protein